MEQTLFVGIFAFLTTLFAVPKIIYVCEKKKLFDNPDAIRKLHSKPVSSLGGLGIFLGFITSVLLIGNLLKHYEFQYYIACFIFIFFIEITSDIRIVSSFLIYHSIDINKHSSTWENFHQINELKHVLFLK